MTLESALVYADELDRKIACAFHMSYLTTHGCASSNINNRALSRHTSQSRLAKISNDLVYLDFRKMIWGRALQAFHRAAQRSLGISHARPSSYSTILKTRDNLPSLGEYSFTVDTSILIFCRPSSSTMDLRTPVARKQNYSLV